MAIRMHRSAIGTCHGAWNDPLIGSRMTWGNILNSTMARIRPVTMELPISTSATLGSGALLDTTSEWATFADQNRARVPTRRESTRLKVPRINGCCCQEGLPLGGVKSQVSTVLPLVFRTATAQYSGERIITPSMTACPPMCRVDSLPDTGVSGADRVESTITSYVEMY